MRWQSETAGLLTSATRLYMKLLLFGSTCFLKYRNDIALDYIRIKVIFSSSLITNHHIPPLGNSTRCGRYYLYHTGEQNVGLLRLISISLCFFLSPTIWMDRSWQYQCCGSEMFITDPGSKFFSSRIPEPNFFSFPDPNFFQPGSRIHIKEFKYFNPNKLFQSSRKYDPGCSPGSRGRKGTGSRIRNTGQYLSLQSLLSERVLILAILVAGILIQLFIKNHMEKI